MSNNKTLKDNLNTLNQLYNQCQDSNLDVSQSIEILEQSIGVAQQCLTQLAECKGKLIVLQQRTKELIDED